MTTEQIELTDEFKATISYFVERSETNRTDYILRELIEGSFVDYEFGHLIFPESTNNQTYDEQMDLVVLDAVETEIKRQLLDKFDR